MNTVHNPGSGSETASPANWHLLRIDVLRAVAILAVFALHWFGHAFGTDHLAWSGLVRDPASAPSWSFFVFFPMSFGWMGVPLFFVISGFCIHGSALKHGELRVGTFFWRRFWRIYPPYIAALIFSAAMAGISLTAPENRGQLWSHLLLVHNFNSNWIFALNGVLWSLAVEAQLYVLYPLLWRLRARWGIAGALKFTLLLSVAARLCFAFFMTDWSAELSGPLWTSPILLWFDWTLGAFLAERYVRGQLAFPAGQALRWTALAAVVLSTFTKPTAIFSFSLTSVFTALAAESYLRRDRPLAAVEQLLVPLGLCSYSFYLIHYPLVPLIADQLRRTAAFRDTASLICAAPLAIALIGVLSFAAFLTIERASIIAGRWLLAHIRSAPGTT